MNFRDLDATERSRLHRQWLDEQLANAEIIEAHVTAQTVQWYDGLVSHADDTGHRCLTIEVHYVERKPEAEHLAEERSKRQTAALPPGHEVAKREALTDDPTSILEEAETDPRVLADFEPWHHGR